MDVALGFAGAVNIFLIKVLVETKVNQFKGILKKFGCICLPEKIKFFWVLLGVIVFEQLPPEVLWIQDGVMGGSGFHLLFLHADLESLFLVNGFLKDTLYNTSRIMGDIKLLT